MDDRSLLYKVERPIYSFENLVDDFTEDDDSFSLLSSLKDKARNFKVSFRSIMFHLFPMPFILKSFYKPSTFLYDLIAGLTLVVFQIPQGMAYGMLAGLEPINGLYSSFFPPLIYFFLGTSRHLSIGVFSVLTLLSSVPVYRETNEIIDANMTFNQSFAYDVNLINSRLQVSIATTLLAGIIQLGMGLCQIGGIMNFISDALIGGFTTATTVHVIVSQLSPLLGVSIRHYSGVGELPFKLYLFAINIKKIHWITIGISLVCIAILTLFSEFLNPKIQKKFKFPFPIQLILVILGTVISYYCQFSDKYQVKIVGAIPKGFPVPTIPDITIWPRIAVDAVLLAIVGFVTSSALAKIYSLKFSYDVNFNQELIAYGISNILGSFFKCTIAAGALARSTVAVQVGMKSQIASLISCVFMVFVLLFIGPLFQHVPISVLAAIIVASVKGLLWQLGDLPRLYYLSKFDFNVWIVSFLATLLLNVPFGLVVGFLFSLLTIIIRLQNPKSQILGQLPKTDIYKNMKLFKDAKEIPGVKIFRYDTPLYFANAEHFQSKLYKKSGINPLKVKRPKKEDYPRHIDSENNTNTVKHRESSIGCEEVNDEKCKIKIEESIEEVKFIIIDMSSINYVDNVAIRILEEIYASYRSVGVSLYLAGPNNKIRSILKKAKFAEGDLNRIMFVTIHDAVLKIFTDTELTNL